MEPHTSGAARDSGDSWYAGWDVICGSTHDHREGAQFYMGKELGRKLDAVSVERRNINYNTGGYVAGNDGIEFTGVKETLLHRVVKAHRDAGLPTELATTYIEELMARGADITLKDEASKTAAELDAERSLCGWGYFPMLVPDADDDSAVEKVLQSLPIPLCAAFPPPSVTGRKAPTDRFVETVGEVLDYVELQLEEVQRMEEQATRDALEMHRQARDMHNDMHRQIGEAGGSLPSYY